MSSDVEIHITAFDEASSVIESAGASITETFQNIEGQTETLASTTTEATSQVANSYNQVAEAASAAGAQQDTSQASFGGSVMAMNNVALAGTNLFMSYERVQNAQVMVDRSNLMVQRSTETAEKAQTTYNDAVAKFGPNSTQAKEALDKLTIAQQALQVAHERADMSARNYNNTMLMSAVMVIPSLVSIIGTVSHAQEIWTGIQWALNAAMDANPIGIIVLAIAGLVAVFIAAYTYCEPFRDAINALGSAIGGAFIAAVNGVRDALMFLWNDVLKPIADFFVEVLTANIEIVIDVWNAFGAAWNTVCSAIGGFWNTYIKPIVDFIVNIFIAQIKVLMTIWQDALNVWNALCSGISAIWNATVGPVVAAVQWFANTIHSIFQMLFGWIVGGSIWTDLCGGLLTIWNDTIGPLINAVQGFCNTVVGFFQGAASVLSNVWNGIVGGVESAWNMISGAANSVGSAISGGLSAAGNAISGAANTVENSMSTVTNAVSGGLSKAGSAISNFIGSICFAHALANAAGDSQKTMTDWASMMGEKMGKGLSAIKDFNVGANISGGGAAGAVGAGGNVPVGSAVSRPVIYISAPLVQIQGSADKATAKLAAQYVQESLQNVIVEPTSSAGITRKRVRIS